MLEKLKNYFMPNKIDFNELNSYEIMNEKCIFHYYIIARVKPEEISEKKFNEILIENQSKALQNLRNEIMNIDLGTKRKNLIQEKDGNLIFFGEKTPTIQTIEREPRFYEGNTGYIMRFNDTKAEKYKKTTIEFKDPYEKRNYRFTPIQYLKFIEIAQKIEEWILNAFDISSVRKNGIPINNFIINENDEPLVEITDGVFYLKYPFEKRIQIYKKDKKVDKELFGPPLDEKVKWIEKRKEEQNMDKYYSKITNLLDEYNLSNLY